MADQPAAVYADTSVLAKLVVAKAETDALARQHLDIGMRRPEAVRGPQRQRAPLVDRNCVCLARSGSRFYLGHCGIELF